MKLFRAKTNAGLQILWALTQHERAGEAFKSCPPLRLADMEAQLPVSGSYLEQLFSELKAKGLVCGMRGPGGGYRLKRNERGIPVYESLKLFKFHGLFYPEEVELSRITTTRFDTLALGDIIR